MKKLYDDVYSYRGFGLCESKCHIEAMLDEKTSRVIVIATELPDNSGTSITNFAEYLATEIFNRLRYEAKIIPENFIWIEHYPERGTVHYPLVEDYDRVYFEIENGKFAHPKWEHIKEFDIDKI